MLIGDANQRQTDKAKRQDRREAQGGYMELFHANRQWATRPDDERETTIKGLYEKTLAYRKLADDKMIDAKTLRAVAIDGEVQIVGKGGKPAKVTNWAFGQLAHRYEAPAAYLRTLSAELAAENLNFGMVKRAQEVGGEDAVNALFHINHGLLLRAITSDRYVRIWNWEVAERLLDMESKGWTPATPDIRRKNDDPNDPHNFALYVSDHDMFAFIMRPDRVIKEPGNELGLKRGMIVGNSEVGGGALWGLRFLYREMCGNHIIWGAEEVFEIRARHVGSIRERFAEWDVQIQQYLEESSTADEAKIKTLKRKKIAGTKEELLDALFGKKSLGLSRKALEASYEAVIPDVDGDALTAWGIAQGVTRYSQATPYADERTKLDRAAGKILDMF